MKKASQTYRFFSALTLMLLISSFVLPAGLSAANLLCDIGMPEMNHAALACCELNSADQSKATISVDKVPCTYQEVCENVLSKDQSAIEAVPQLTQHFTAVLVSKDVSYPLFDDSSAEFFHTEPSVRPSAPPIFLLNSAFLN